MHEDGFTIAEAAARCGLPESTLRYWERVGLLRRIERDPSSRHRRYSAPDVALLETLANLRAVGLSLADMRAYPAAATRPPVSSGPCSRRTPGSWATSWPRWSCVAATSS
jgi:MerR family transcriptional regulator, aldehyde-responsive regulator